MSNLKYIGKNILNHDLILKKGNVSGSASSTGSFGNLNISSDASITGDMVVGGKLTAEQFHTEITSASIIFASGSTIFGDTQDDIHRFTGSLNVTGSVTALNLTADSSSFSTRLTTEESNIDSLQTDSGSFSTRITNFSTGNVELVSGSATSTGSFGKVEAVGRVEAEHIHSTDDISADGRVTSADAVIGNLVTINGNGIWVGNDQKYITVGGGFDFQMNHRHPEHTSPFRSGQNTNILTDKTNSGLLLFGGNPGIMMESPVSGSEGFFLSGSRANIELRGGNISGSAQSTGSFGKLVVGDDIELVEDQRIYFEADKATYIESHASDSFRAVVNDRQMLLLDEDTGNRAVFGNGTKVYIGADNNKQPDKELVVDGDISGSATSTGSFGKILGDGSDISNLPVSAINNATENRLVTIGATTSELDAESTLTFNGTQLDLSSAGHATVHITGASGKDANLKLQNNSRLWIFQNDGDNTLFGGSGALHLFDGTAAASRIIVDSTGVIQTPMGVSGSAQSTASFGHFIGDGSGLENVFEGTVPSASISTRITKNEISASVNAASSASFSTRVTKNEGTGSKILNGQLGFTNITASGNISSSGEITGNVLNVGLRVKAIGSSLEFAGDTLDFVDGNSINRLFKGTAGGSVEAYHAGVKKLETTSGGINVIGNITGSGHISMSLSSTGSFGRVSATTGSFGRVSATTIGGHSPLSVDSITTFTNVITASSAVQFDGKIFIETGSIEGDLHVRTNENLMRIGKSTSGLIVSGSEEVSRFATGSDGSIIDLGFTVTDEDGNVVLAGDGDGIHVDSNNYWYNNKYYKIGNGVNKFLSFDNVDLKYKGQVFASTGSFDGEMFINSPTGSMFIGKFTGGIPSSGSANVSRFATGSDGSIIDLGFTTTNEEGETVFLTTGDGVVVDSNNYWYTTGHFKVGNDDKSINWDTNNLTLTKVTASGDFFVQGDSYVQEYIYHKGDNDTYLRFAPNLVNLAAGGKSAIKYDASAGKVIINNTNANVDFHVMADDGEEILATDAANNRVGINTTTPGVALEVVGDISGSAQSTGSFGSLVVDGASLDFSNVPTSDPGIAGRVWRDGTDLKISVG